MENIHMFKKSSQVSAGDQSRTPPSQVKKLGIPGSAIQLAASPQDFLECGKAMERMRVPASMTAKSAKSTAANTRNIMRLWRWRMKRNVSGHNAKVVQDCL